MDDPNDAKKQVVVLIHGIRTMASWMSDIRGTLQQAGFTVVPTSYGEYSLARFLFPGAWLRRGPIETIRQQIERAMDTHKVDSVSVIAHSFGTYVVAQILAQEPQIRWRRIILSGSVIPQRFPFNQYAERFEGPDDSSPILNEVGTKDFLPALAESVTWGYGHIGTHGLNDGLVENRWREGLSHSDFLTPAFVGTHWVPFLQGKGLLEGDPARTSFASRLITKIRLKYWIPGALLLCSWFLISGKTAVLCEGQYEASCGFAHTEYAQCYQVEGATFAWARKNWCFLGANPAQVGASRFDDRCGYTKYKLTCRANLRDWY